MLISSAWSPMRTRVTVLWWSAPWTLIALEAPLPFVDVIRDVRQEVGVLAALLRPLAHHAVLVVAEVRGLEPQRAVLLVRVAGGHQPAQRLLDLAAPVQRRLEEVDVELHAEGLQVRVLDRKSTR